MDIQSIFWKKMRTSTFDIGGANTKRLVYEDGSAYSSLHYFPIWKKRDELQSFLTDLAVDSDAVAVTMTAELCDVFSSKEEGVKYIVKSCLEAFEEPFFLADNMSLLPIGEVKDYRQLGATNWLASLYYMKKKFAEGILVDIGSTTTDILPFGKEPIIFKSDLERLKSSELLYTGYLRTPVNTIVSELPLGDHMVSPSAEYFAITADVYKILWGVDYSCETPDGKGKSRDESESRVARLLCAERDEVRDDIEDICRHIYRGQVEMISNAVEYVSRESGMDMIYLAGIGKELGIAACNRLNREAVDLEGSLKDAWNLPCQGLREMVLDRK